MNINIKLDQLTGLRFFAALLVFLSHLNWDGSNQVYVKIFESGYVGVSFFFLLSGFVLSYSYRERVLNRSLGFIKYVLLRLARLTPLHYLTAVPFVLFAIHKGEIDFLNLAINLSYIQSWIPNSEYYFSFNSPSWSLSDEMFFYICFFPLVFVRPGLILGFFILLAVFVFLSAFFVEVLYPGHIFLGGYAFAHWLFYIFPGFRLLEFISGMLLFRLWEKGFRLPGWLAIISYIFLAASMYFAKNVPESFRFSLFFLPFVALFFYSHLTEGVVFSRVYSSRVLVLLGNASFAFYLIHQPLIVVLKHLSSRFGLSNFCFFVFSGFIIALLSVAVYMIYEKRAEAYLKMLIMKRCG